MHGELVGQLDPEALDLLGDLDAQALDLARHDGLHVVLGRDALLDLVAQMFRQGPRKIRVGEPRLPPDASPAAPRSGRSPPDVTIHLNIA
jgi:hypothetical protein